MSGAWMFSPEGCCTAKVLPRKSSIQSTGKVVVERHHCFLHPCSPLSPIVAIMGRPVS